MTAIFTPGYAAAEQFTSAKQGPWTDIYGLAATLYHAITGHPPPSAFDRMLDDAYEPLGKTGAGRASHRGLLAGIDAGLAVRASDRPQTIAGWRPILGQAAASRRRHRHSSPCRRPRQTTVGTLWKPRRRDRSAHRPVDRCGRRAKRGAGRRRLGAAAATGLRRRRVAVSMRPLSLLKRRHGTLQLAAEAQRPQGTGGTREAAAPRPLRARRPRRRPRSATRSRRETGASSKPKWPTSSASRRRPARTARAPTLPRKRGRPRWPRSR